MLFANDSLINIFKMRQIHNLLCC